MSGITDTYVYDAYGNLLKQTGTTENDYLYMGKQYNASTGLYYLRARYMNSETSIFTSMDTYARMLDNSVSLHKYLYANPNPVMYTDSNYNPHKTLELSKAIDVYNKSVRGAINQWYGMNQEKFISFLVTIPVVCICRKNY